MSHVKEDEVVEKKLVVEGGDIVPTAEAVGQQNTNTMATSKFEPPAFISDTKTYADYKKDLYMWSRITGVAKKIQAEVVV